VKCGCAQNREQPLVESRPRVQAECPARGLHLEVKTKSRRSTPRPFEGCGGFGLVICRGKTRIRC
jgi:hypothetical protein